jgi:hypothetical protein
MKNTDFEKAILDITSKIREIDALQKKYIGAGRAINKADINQLEADIVAAKIKIADQIIGCRYTYEAVTEVLVGGRPVAPGYRFDVDEETYHKLKRTARCKYIGKGVIC